MPLRLIVSVLVGMAVIVVVRTTDTPAPAPRGHCRLPAPRRCERDRPGANATKPQPPLRPTGDGFLVVDQARPAVGSGSGSVVTYSIEVEPVLRAEAHDLVTSVAAALDDTTRGWAGEAQLQQVADPGAATVRILLARPATVDGLCAQTGYATAGQFSCWNGRFTALNLMRWRDAAPGFDSVAQYRVYQVNHEFGHALGYGHSYCPGDGSLAPLMMQQTKGLLGCRPNPWPHP